MLYCRLIYMLSILCVRLTIKVKVAISESFKVGWYPPKKLGRVTLMTGSSIQGVRSQGVEILIRALWFSSDAEQDWNQLAFPLSIRCEGKKNGAVQLEVGSDLLLYIFTSLQSVIKFNIWRISMRYTETIQVIFNSQSYKLRCFFAFYVYVVSKWPIEYYRLKVAFYLASQNQMIINGYKKNMLWFYKLCLCMQIFRVNFYEPLRFFFCTLTFSLLVK